MSLPTTSNAETAEPAEHHFALGFGGALFAAELGEYAEQEHSAASACSAFDVVA